MSEAAETMKRLLGDALLALARGDDAVDAERRAKAISALVKAEREVAELMAAPVAPSVEEDENLDAPNCVAGLLSLLQPISLAHLLKLWSGSRLRDLLNDWRCWARREQIAPDGDWRTWVFMGGRGAGKTRAGAEWVSELARWGEAKRIALIAPTFHDVREVMIEGASGLRALADERPVYEASRKRLTWANGAQAYCFSAEDPESLRGPQFDAAWLMSCVFGRILRKRSQPWSMDCVWASGRD